MNVTLAWPLAFKDLCEIDGQITSAGWLTWSHRRSIIAAAATIFIVFLTCLLLFLERIRGRTRTALAF